MDPTGFDTRPQEKSPARAGLEVWRLERGRGEESSEILRAAFGGPDAGAFAGGRRPGARAVGARHTAGAGGAVAAAGHDDGHGAVLADLAGDVERGATRVADRAVLDLDRVAVGAVAGAFFGDDQDAPVSVEVTLAGSDRGREGRGCGSRQDRESGEGASGGLVEAGHCEVPVIWNFVIGCVTHPCFSRMLRVFRRYRVLVTLFRRDGGRLP